MISEELLSKVLEVKIIEEPKMHLIEKQELCYWTSQGLASINIHELAHKCKEWAEKQEYQIFSRPKSNRIRKAIALVSVEEQNKNCTFRLNALFEVMADTEPEAIFKVCEWILNNG